jgi:hypothetical protein
MQKKTIISLILSWVILFIIVIRIAPQFLIWPHYTKIGYFDVYSEEVIDPHVSKILQSAQELIVRSSIRSTAFSRSIFLTNGGWRWKLISLRSSGAFAISIPFTEAIITNETRLRENIILTGRIRGGIRNLDRVIAHEMTHGLLRSHFGYFETILKPDWLIEGYCDYVADNSSLSEADVADLKAKGENHPAIQYFEGRKKIAKLINVDRMTIDQIFAAN